MVSKPCHAELLVPAERLLNVRSFVCAWRWIGTEQKIKIMFDCSTLFFWWKFDLGQLKLFFKFYFFPEFGNIRKCTSHYVTSSNMWETMWRVFRSKLFFLISDLRWLEFFFLAWQKNTLKSSSSPWNPFPSFCACHHSLLSLSSQAVHET